jgi:hypothetical protein
MNYFGDLAPAAQPTNEPRACGWFDSSHDLQQGLLVQEHVCLDTLAGALSLSDWLAWYAVSNQVTPPR